jgi:hypothetical protein
MCMQSADEKMFEKYRDYLEGAIEFLKQVLSRYSAVFSGIQRPVISRDTA